MQSWSRWIPVVFGFLVSVFMLLPLFVATEAPIDPPGSDGPPWCLKAGLALLALGALSLRAVPAGPGRTKLVRGIGLFALYLIYTGNQAIRTTDDNVPNRYLPWVVAGHGSLDLASVVRPQAGHLPYYVAQVGDRVLSTFPLGTGLLGVPYALVGVHALGRLPEAHVLLKAEKHLAALLATVSVLFFFLAVRSRLSERAALATAAVFGLATPLLSCASQGLWSVTGELVFVSLALLMVLPASASDLRLAAGGLAMGGAFLCRPSALLVAAGLAALLAAERRWRSLWFAAAGALAMGTAAGFLFTLYGNPLGGYAILNLHGSMWNLPGLPEGLAGNLVSPSRGLLLFLPWLLLAPVGLRRAPRPLRHLWLLSLSLVVAYLLLSGAYTKWWGGFALGPRLQTESAPFCALLVAPLLAGFSAAGRWRTAFVALLGFSAGTQALAAYRDQPSAWNTSADPDRRPEILWSLRNSQLAATWIPRWRIALPPYRPVLPQLERAGEWIAVDLSEAANARYDQDPFQPSPQGAQAAHYPRLDPRVAGKAGWFQLLPRGRLNAVTTCRGAEPAEIALPPVRTRRLVAILAAGGATGSAEESVASTAVVRFANGGTLEIPLRLDREVFEYWTSLRRKWPPESRIYAGNADDPDVLVWTVLKVHPRGRVVRTLRLVGNGEGSLGVTLFALSVEPVGPETRPKGPFIYSP